MFIINIDGLDLYLYSVDTKGECWGVEIKEAARFNTLGEAIFVSTQLSPDKLRVLHCNDIH